jgi:cation diffusion facilitator family transporter
MSAELTQHKTAMTGSPSPANKQSVLAGWLSLAVNVALLALNLWMAALSGSLALAAETTHNLLDLLASIAVLVGVTLSQRKARAFPYGLYKVENVVAVFIAFGTFFTGYEIAREALFAARRTPDVRPLMLAGVILAAAIPLVFSYYELRLGRCVNSPSLIADATEFRAHVLSSGVVFAALAGQLLGWPLDRPAALVIVLWIAYAGWKMLRDTMCVLLDASIDADTLNLIRQLVTAKPEVTQVKSLTGRNSGRYRFIEMEVALSVDDLKHAHEIASEIEAQIRSEIPFIERVLVHTEPAKRDFLRIAVPLSTDGVTVAENFGPAARYGLFDVRPADGKILNQEILTNPYALEGKGRGILLANWLKTQGVDLVLISEPLKPSGLMYALQAGGVRLEQAGSQPLVEIIRSVIKNGAVS